MTECPTCLRPMATAEDDAAYRAGGAAIAAWADVDGTHLCWRTIYGDDDCQTPQFAKTAAEVRDMMSRAEKAEAAIVRVVQAIKPCFYPAVGKDIDVDALATAAIAMIGRMN